MTSLTREVRQHGLWLLLLLAFVPWSPVRAQAQRVTEVRIEGNQRINQQTILTVVSTKEGDEFSAERVERDRHNIEELGYFRLVTAATQPVGNGLRVLFVVREFPVVTQFDITGGSLFKLEQLQKVIKTKVGQVFNRVNWEADLNAITKMYSDKGYQVRTVQNLDQPEFLDKGIVRLEIQELKVGTVKIKWPTREVKDKKTGKVLRTETQHKTKDYVVLRELAQKPGALYNSQQIQKDYKALNNLGFFETINPVVEVAENLTVAITWELTEKRTGQVSVGAGYSPREQLIGRAELADTNFRGHGQSVSISTEIGSFGGDGLPSVEFRYFEPWLTSTKTSLTVDVYDKLVYRFSEDIVNFNKNNQYFERRLGGQLTFGRPFQWPVSLGIRYDSVNTRNLPPKVDFPHQNGQVIAGNVQRLWKNSDYPNYPTQGGSLRLSAEAGHASLDKSQHETFTDSFFSKYIVDARKYIALKHIKATKEPEREQQSQKVPVVALRVMAGTIAGNVPFFEQFFVGGAETLRGYLEDRFWGNTMYVASIEYRRPLMNRIVGVLFADVGDAFNSNTAFQFTNPRLRTDFRQFSGIRAFPSVGIGLRVATPIGPIRLDFGYGKEGGRTHFSIGQTF